MKTRIKNYLIPREENDYTPHALQAASVSVMLLLILISFTIANLQSVLWFKSDWLVSNILPSVIVELTNEERSGDELVTLSRSEILDEAATLKAEDMATKHYFAHTSPEGIDPWHWFDEAGYNFVYAGENLAVRFSDSEDVVDAWMASPGHRANILGGNYTEIGVGTAKGTYEGVDTVFVVQLFGSPAVAAAAPQEPTSTRVVKREEPIVLGLQQPENTPETKGVSTTASSQATEPNNTADFEETETISQEQETLVFYSDTATTARSQESGAASDGGDAVTTATALKTPGAFARAAVQPNLWLQVLYGILACAVVGMLVLSIVVEWRRQRPVQLAYGAFLIASMAILFYVHISMTTSVLVV